MELQSVKLGNLRPAASAYNLDADTPEQQPDHLVVKPRTLDEFA